MERIKMKGRRVDEDDEQSPPSRGRDEPKVRELEEGLLIDQNALDEALLRQPDMFYRVSKQSALVVSRRDAAKQHIAEIEAEVEQKEHALLEKHKEKATVGEIKANVRLHPKVKAAYSEHLRLAREAAELEALKEAFKQRSYVLKELVSLYIANYYGDNSGGSAGKRLKTMEAETTKSRMRELRRERERDRD